VTAIASGIAVFGVAAYWEWIAALRQITWGPEVMNASLSAIASRGPWNIPAATVAAVGVLLVAITMWRTRAMTLTEAWMPLVAVSLLASPLGWVYYGLWMLPGTRREDWTRGAALGWCAPLLAVAMIANVHAALWLLVGCCYGWTLLALWWRAINRHSEHQELAIRTDTAAYTSAAI
jgi:hypothetical protein